MLNKSEIAILTIAVSIGSQNYFKMKQCRHFMQITYSPNNVLITMSCRLRGGCERLLPQFRLQISQELLSRLRRAAGYFPGMPCYEHFVTLQKSVFVPLVFFLISHLGTRTGLYYIDSTALPVCDNHRINRHKVFAGLAQRGKMGWFFGFKLHLVFNNCHEIVALKLTPGNVHDTTPVPALT